MNRVARSRTGRFWAAVVAVVLASGTAACGDDTSSGSDASKPTVVAAFAPLEEVARAVAGDRANVVGLVPPGGGAHDYEPTAQQLEALSESDLVVYFGADFQPGVQDAVAALDDSVVALDLLRGLDLLPVGPKLPGTEGDVDGEVLATGDDPHVWLDPRNMMAMTRAVTDALSALDPDGQAMYERNRDSYLAQLERLDSDMAGGLTGCASDVIVTSHRAFEYLAQRFGLTQISIAGISPDAEPSAATLEAVAAAAAANNVSVIFFEENLPPDLAETVADEIGASTAVLDPVETLSTDQLAAGESYLTIQRTNLAALRAGLGCP
jgi:zinc transport system substrate-binding protein